MNILLGLTGSVATILAPKLVKQLKEVTGPDGEVRVVVTESAKHFLEQDDEGQIILPNTLVYTEYDEWHWLHQENEFLKKNIMRNSYKKDDKIMHIELSRWADVLVVAPLSANTLAKMANGICDNLLTSIFLAWDWDKPVVVAPSMNTKMYESKQTWRNLREFKMLGVGHSLYICGPVSKNLACGEEGMGAMADINDICKIVGFLKK